MTTAEIAARALWCWLLFPAIAIPVGLIAWRRGHPSLLRRVMPWLAVVPVALVPAYASRDLFLLLLVACDAAACWEIVRLQSGNRHRGTTIPLVGALAVSVPWLAWARAGASFPDRLAILAIALPLLAMAFVRRAPRPAWEPIALAFAVGAGLSYWVLLERSPGGFRFVLVAFSGVAIHDIMAFAIGKLIGGPRVFPTLSPAKTYAGYVGGTIGALLMTGLLSFALPELGVAGLTMAGIVLAVGAVSGDLAASAIKRRYGVKDFGTLLGPQGGLLDRLDSLLGAGWIFYWYLRLAVSI